MDDYDSGYGDVPHVHVDIIDSDVDYTNSGYDEVHTPLRCTHVLPGWYCSFYGVASIAEAERWRSTFGSDFGSSAVVCHHLLKLMLLTMLRLFGIQCLS